MPTFGTPSYAGNTGGMLSVAKPGDVTEGDIVILAARCQYGGADELDFTAPAGFTQINPAHVDVDGPGARRNGLWWKLATGSEPATYDLEPPGAGRNVAMAFRLVPDERDTPVTLLNQSRGTDGPFGATEETYTGLTLFMSGAEFTAGNSHHPTSIPTGSTLAGVTQNTGDESTSGSRTGICVAYRVENNNTLPADAFQYAASSAGYMSRSVLNGAFPGESVGVGVPVATAAGEASATVVISGVRVAPAYIRAWRPAGIATAADSVTGGATWAHRGGSLNFPECSERAYDQAVLLGFGALEFSCARTSDGVWFGLHDQTLDRTSQTTGNLDPAAMTWAQVQEYSNTLNSNGIPRPYYRLDAFLAKYQGHVLIVDPKFAFIDHMPELLDMLDAESVKTQTIVKFSGVGTGATGLVAAPASSRGYKTWGFFYENDYTNGDLDTYQAAWDYLGMDIGAGEAAWSAVLGYSKPVVGHIAADQAAYNAAMSKGATAVQCSGIVSIAPVQPT